MDNQQSLDHFENNVEVIEHVEGAIGNDLALIDLTLQEAGIEPAATTATQ